MRRNSSFSTSVSVLALVLGLSACAGGAAGPSAESAEKSSMLLQIADETDASGDPATAASLYRQLHNAAPQDPVPLGRLAGSLLRMGDDRGAADAYRAALALAPGSEDFHRGLALSLLLVGDTDGALAEIRSGLTKRPDDPRLYSLLGVAQDLTGRHDLAQQTYRHGMEIAPANTGLRNNYALSLALAGNYAGAVSEFQGIAGPGAAPRYRLNLALAYGLSGDDTKAAATAREVLDERSVEANLADYALLRGMDEAHRTAAIIGSELHGAALVAGVAHPPSAPEVAATQAVVAPPPPVAVASSPLPTIPASPPSAAAPPVPVLPVAASAAPASPQKTPPASTAAHALPQSRLTTTGDTMAHEAAAKEPSVAPPPAVASAPVAPIPASSSSAAAQAEPVHAAAASAAPASPPTTPPASTAVHALSQSRLTATGDTIAEQISSFLNRHLPIAAQSGEGQTAAQVIDSFVAPASAKTDLPEVTVAASRAAAPERYAVQLASFMTGATAQKVAEDYAAKGIATSVFHAIDRNGQEWFAIRTGEFDSADAAQAMLHQIQSLGCPDAILVHQRATDSRA